MMTKKKELSDLSLQERLNLLDHIARKIALHQGWVLKDSANILGSENPRIIEFALLAETALKAVETYLDSTK